MRFFTKEVTAKLLANGVAQDEVRGSDDEFDFAPVVKLFTPDANCTWLLTELDPEDQDIAFGLCDLGMGTPELGSVSIAELKQLRGKLGLPVERDLHFTAKYPLTVYADAARSKGAITLCLRDLGNAALSKTQRQRLDADYQRKVADFVGREVKCCVSYLVADVAKTKEDFLHLFSAFDPDRARELIAEAIEEEPCNQNEIEHDNLDVNDDADLPAILALCSIDRQEAECEVFEHWIVTDWLADKLEAKGETVERDFYGLAVWGRATTGQAISIDDVICNIFDEIHSTGKDKT